MTKKSIFLTVFSIILLLIYAFLSLFSSDLSTTFSTSIKTSRVICIDAGHGGIDNGVYGISSGTPEAKINLEIAKYLQKELSSLGFTVVLTRENDDGLYGDTTKGFKRRDMEKRKEIAVLANADLIISIHCNYSKIKTAKGINVYYNKTDELSTYFADILTAKLNDLSSKNVRKDSEKMFITHNIGIPAVIIECGFLSNVEDEKNLIDDSYKKKLAEKIALCVYDIFSDQ